MPPKLIPVPSKEGYVPEKKRYSKPKEYKSGVIEEYIYERDMCWYNNIFTDPVLREEIAKKYGII